MRRKGTLTVIILLGIIFVALGILTRHRAFYAHEPLRDSRPNSSFSAAPSSGTPQAVLISTTSANESFAAPHRANMRSLYALRWTFGGKRQNGWHLYAPLIGELINSNDSATSLAFAAALARWQGSVGLPPTGIVDEETMMEMVRVWQGRRSSDRTYPTLEQLLTAPATEFYDPTRAIELCRVERRTYRAYKRMLQAAIADRTLNISATPQGELIPGEKRLRIISAFRSREYQARLRKLSPNSGRAGLALNSPHFTGRALDLYIAGEPVETKDSNRALQVNTSIYRWLVRNAGRFGFRPYFYEPWHWEYDPMLDPTR